MTEDQEKRLVEMTEATHSKVSEMARDCKYCQEKLREYHHDLNGNGQTGLKDRMTTVEGKLASSEDANVWIRNKMGIAVLVALAMAATAVGANQVINRIFPEPTKMLAPDK